MPAATVATIEPVLDCFRQALAELYGPALDRVVLFGSRARGDAEADSDYKTGISFGSYSRGQGPQGTQAFTAIGGQGSGGASFSMANGIDWSKGTVTGFWEQYGNVASLDATGNHIATSYRANGSSGPTWTAGSGAPSSTQPKGSYYSRSDGSVGSTMYVSQGGGTWEPCGSRLDQASSQARYRHAKTCAH
jgi:hypothetical protein